MTPDDFLRHFEATLRQQQEPLEASVRPAAPAGPEDKVIYDSITANYHDKRQHDLSAVIPLTHRKTSDIVKRDGFAITGFVLTHPDGRKCIVDMSVVRWFHDKDGKAFFWMMHPDNPPPN